MSVPSRRAVRGLLASGGALALLTVPVAAASAHVTVHPDTTAAGSFAELAFRVPNESDTAGTVRVAVDLPQQDPLAVVSVRPVPGWTARVTTAPLPAPVEVDGATITQAPRTVTWTADRGTQIGPGQYQEFALSAGPLPDSGDLVLPAVQTYSDGRVVRWDQPTPEGGPEPENPAPTFAITAAAADGGEGGHTHGGSATSSASSASSASSTLQVDDAHGSDILARWLGAGGLAVGIAGLAVAALALRRRSS